MLTFFVSQRTGRLIYKNVSNIAAKGYEFEKFKEANGEQFAGLVSVARKKKEFTEGLFKARGLRVKEFDRLNAIDDLREKDDGGKLIENDFVIEVKSPEELEQAIKLCKEIGFMAMPIGGKTSALGVFVAAQQAKAKGLNGVIGIEIKQIPYRDARFGGPQGAPAEAPKGLEIPDFDKSQYKLICHPGGLPIAILKSKTFPDEPSKPHRVIAHAGLYAGDINKFLQQTLRDKRYKYRIMADPTSINEAQVGGVVATGAQGGNRVSSAEDVLSISGINAKGERYTANGAEAQKTVGLNGNAGFVMQAEFEVSAFPPKEHGIFIPIKGGTKRAAFTNLCLLQEKLAPHCKAKNGDRLQAGHNENGTIITGMEPLSRKAIEMATDEDSGPLPTQLNSIMGGYEYGLYVTFSSFADSEEILTDSFLKDTLGIDLYHEETKYDEHGNVKIEKNRYYDRVKIFDSTGRSGSSELEKMDEIRHSAPSKSREKARQLGGVTQSTDLNIRFLSDDPQTRGRARRKVAAIYSKYIDGFQEEDGFVCAVYGHMHPGSGQGGGMDPHVRFIFDLSHPGNRYSAPEDVLKMKKAQSKLYRELLALADDQKLGIEINCPEKSRFTNSEYWFWLKMNKPQEAAEYLELVTKYGCDEKGRALIGGRIPNELPGMIQRYPGGIKALLNSLLIKDEAYTDAPNSLPAILQKHWPAIIEICQNSHRGPDLKAILGETASAIHEKFKLKDGEQYSFFIESEAEGRSVIKRNLGGKHGFNMQTVTVNSLEELEAGLFPDSENTFYMVNVEGIGVPKGMCVMIAPRKAIKEAYNRTVKGDNKEVFRNLADMAQKWPYETGETPNLPAIASLGVILQEGTDNSINQHRAEFKQKLFAYLKGANSKKNTFNDIFTRTLTELKDEMPEERREEVATLLTNEYAWMQGLSLEEAELYIFQQMESGATVNPGPSQIHQAIKDGIEALMKRGRELTPEKQKEIIAKLQDFLGIPRNHKMAFFASASQQMQMIAEAIAKKQGQVHVIQIINGSFSDRFNGYLKSQIENVNTIDTPWTTSENSYLTEILDKVIEQIEEAKRLNKKAVLFVTPHKTSSTADFHPRWLVDALKEKGYNGARDYEMVCDVTSGGGARDYASDVERDTGKPRIPFNGMFGSVQKALGLPPGFSFISLSSQLKELLCDGIEQDEFSLDAKIKEADKGETANPLMLAMLEQKLDAEKSANRTPKEIQEECREKAHLVLGWANKHPDLMTLVQNSQDQSPLLIGLFSQAKNLVIAKRIMAEVFGYHLGGGYGPFEAESIRLYLPNIAKEQLLKLLTALDYVLELDDVVGTRGEHIPNIALREPHEPYKVIERLSNEFVADDIYKDASGLGWLDRVLMTYNANVKAGNGRKIRTRGDGSEPQLSGGFIAKAKIYGSDENMDEMEKILDLSDESDKNILDYYDDYKNAEYTIKSILEHFPELTEDSGDFNQKRMTTRVHEQENKAREALSQIARLLKTYVFGEEGAPQTARRDKRGRVANATVA